MKFPIKVAQIIGMSDGGVASIIMSLYRAIDKNKVQFDFLVESESSIINSLEIESMGGKVIYIPSYKNPIKYMNELKKIFKQNNYDIVHSNMSTLNFLSLRAAKKTGIGIRISHSHSTANKKEFKKTVLKTILKPFAKKYATHFFSCSELAGTYLFGKSTMIKNKVHIINNAIDIEKFSYSVMNRNKIREIYGMSDDFVVGHVGRMQQQKNQLFLLDIFSEILKIQKNAKLIIVGDGPLKEQLVCKIKELNLSSNVILTGNVKNTYDFYSAMDVFLLPSLYEGLPIVGVEAQANGLPCYFSNKITQEAKIIETTEYINLKYNALAWAKEILSHSNQRLENISIPDFDINKVSNYLVDLYLEFLN